jgi:hypothetical protein
VADRYPNIDEFGRGSCSCGGTMTGCAVCATANVLVRYGKPIPRLADGTPDMRTLGARMGKRHRDLQAVRHGMSLYGDCDENWCTYCAFLELRAAGLPVAHQQLTWAQIASRLAAGQPFVLPGRYGRFPYVSPTSYSSTVPAKGRSDAGFTGAHMVVAWGVGQRWSTGSVRSYAVSDADFGSPSRPVVPPHSLITPAVLRSYWEAYGWSVCYVTKPPPALEPASIPWWGSDVSADMRRAYTAKQVGAKLAQVGHPNYGKAINLVDLEAGLEKRGIYYGTSVQLIDLRSLMKPGTGR